MLRDYIIEIRRSVIEIVAKLFGVDEDEVTGDTLLSSRDEFIGLVAALKEKFGLDISGEDAANLVTVGDVVTYVCDKWL